MDLLKVFLISTALLLTALGIHVSVPLVTEFLVKHVPLTWNFFLLCMKPPYLFLLLNAVIISIAASSRFHHRSHPTPPPFQPPPPYLPMEEDHKTSELNDLEEEEEEEEEAKMVEGVNGVEEEVKTVVVVNGVEEEDVTESLLERKDETLPLAPTLEEVWKAITKSQAMTQLKKMDGGSVVCGLTLRKQVRVSLSQDELNLRVESFIKKVKGQ